MAEKDPRLSSRKWTLAKGSMILYTAMHILNLWVALAAAHNEWIDSAALKDLWSSSLTIWSGGIVLILGLYFGVNAVQKKIENGRGR